MSSVSVCFIKKEYGAVPDVGNVILDIGANKGYFSIYASLRGGKQIYAFEPISDTYADLLDNVRLVTTVHPFNLGVAGKSEKKTFFFSDGKSIISSMVFHENAERTEQVECLSLNDLIIKHSLKSIDLIKMDCEGAEFEILYGADQATLSKVKRIRMEYHSVTSEPTKTIEALSVFLSQTGFTMTKIKRDAETTGIAWFERLQI